MSSYKNNNKPDNFQKSSTLSNISLRHIEKTLPILIAAREEQRHIISIIDSFLDKWLDLAKLLIVVSVPALITLYTLNKDQLNTTPFIFTTIIVLITGIFIYLYAVWYKQRYIPSYIKNSTSRLDLYTTWIEATRLDAKNNELELNMDTMQRELHCLQKSHKLNKKT